ncbi:MAG: class I SAM-dependent DNA methyltransferase [Verrucomicrobiales bacterium]
MATHSELSNFIWSVADLLRGPYRPPQYERVMLPLTVLRRFDCVLEPTKEAVLARYAKLEGGKVRNLDPILNKVAGDGKDIGFHNHSKLDFWKLKGDPDQIALNLVSYINGFSENVRRIFEYFEFEQEIQKLEQANRLFLVISKFCDIDLHPDRVDNIQMGLVFEDLIRRFNEAANETAGDHFTPREVIRLMVNLLLEPDDDLLTKPGIIKKVCDPACGTGGMLAEAQGWLREHNPDAKLLVFGQDYNPRSYAVAASDMLIKGHQESRIEFGNTLTDDQFSGERFDYLLANPPFGVDWKAEQKEVKREHESLGFGGRFGPKLPRVNDGALLFLLHMIDKFEDVDEKKGKYGSRVAIVFNGSPLFTGGAGSGESEIRRWILENDWLEAIVALPEQMFYNTGIGTFVWIVTNRKATRRRGKVQLIDARERWKPMRRSLGDKRRYLTEDDIETVTREHGEFGETDTCKLFDNEDFGYRRITVERPLRRVFEFTREGKEEMRKLFEDHEYSLSLMGALDAIEAGFGFERHTDYNEIADDLKPHLKVIETDKGWKALFHGRFFSTDPGAEPVVKKRHKDGSVEYEADGDLRDFENVPLKEEVEDYFAREVLPYRPDAWINENVVDEQDGEVGKVGYEINFNRFFFRYEPPRDLEEIDTDLEKVEKRILELLEEVTE